MIAVSATVVALLPIVAAVVRALVTGWIPVGDNALIAIRAHDVLGGSMPLLGSWTSASQWVGFDMNFPGPTMFQAFSVPVWLFGPLHGIALAAGLVNATAVVVCAVFAWRIGRLPLLLATNIAVVTLLGSMGSSNLIDPWNANIATLSFLALLFATAALATGDVWALPVTAALATFVIQAHLSYVLLVPGVVAVGLAGFAWTTWSARRGERAAPPRTGSPPTPRRLSGRTIGAVFGVTALVVVAGWALPVYEQFSSNPGNLTKLYRSSKVQPPSTPGFGQAVGGVSLVVARPPLWLAPGWGDTHIDLFHPPPPALPSALLVGAVVAAGVAVAVTAARRRDVSATALATIAVTGVLLSVATAAKGTSPFGLQLAYLRYGWPVSMLTWLAIGYGVARSPLVATRVTGFLDRRGSQTAQRRWIAALRPGVAVGFACLLIATGFALPARHYDVDAPTWALGPSKEFARAAVDALGRQRIVVVHFGLNPSAGIIGPPVMAALVDAGYSVRTDDPVLTYQIGSERLYRPERDGNAPLLVVGASRPDAPTGSTVRLLATTTGLDPEQITRLGELTNRFVDGVRHDGGLRWSSDPGKPSAERRGLDELAATSPAEVPGDLRLLGDLRGQLRPPSGLSPAELDELLDLSNLRAGRSVSLFLVTATGRQP